MDRCIQLLKTFTITDTYSGNQIYLRKYIQNCINLGDIINLFTPEVYILNKNALSKEQKIHRVIEEKNKEQINFELLDKMLDNGFDFNIVKSIYKQSYNFRKNKRVRKIHPYKKYKTNNYFDNFEDIDVIYHVRNYPYVIFDIENGNEIEKFTSEVKRIKKYKRNTSKTIFSLKMLKSVYQKYIDIFKSSYFHTNDVKNNNDYDNKLQLYKIKELISNIRDVEMNSLDNYIIQVFNSNILTKKISKTSFYRRRHKHNIFPELHLHINYVNKLKSIFLSNRIKNSISKPLK